MSSTLIQYRGKGFWMHNAVAEVWLCALCQQIRNGDVREKWIIDLSDKINAALNAKWIAGVLQSDLNSTLVDDRLASVSNIFLEIEDRLFSLAKNNSIVKMSIYAASSEFLTPELEMLRTLFFETSLISTPPHIFTLNKGWVIA